MRTEGTLREGNVETHLRHFVGPELLRVFYDADDLHRRLRWHTAVRLRDKI